jgi:hypothetical protein
LSTTIPLHFPSYHNLQNLAFTIYLGTVGTLSKNFIIGWIKKQVKETSDNDFHFGTFVIIAAFGVRDHQAPHIDMPSPLVQIGVSMTAGCDPQPRASDKIPSLPRSQ